MTNDVHLTVALKRPILTQNIYGVDLDAAAVEVTQLSLYLKMLENENRWPMKPTSPCCHPCRTARELPFPKIDFKKLADKARHDKLGLTPKPRAVTADSEEATLQNAVTATDQQIDQLGYEPTHTRRNRPRRRRGVPITKHGNARLRTALIELASRLVIWQPQSKLVKQWMPVLGQPETNKGARKKAIVAMARQMAVDLWRWKTKRAKPADFGWEMSGA